MGSEQAGVWISWWAEALANEASADALQAAGYHSAAVFHSLMSIETAGKALRLVPVSWDDVDRSGATWDDLAANLTWDDMDGTPKPKKVRGHKLADLLEVPFIDKTTRDAVREELSELRKKLGNRDPYLACRYPDQWAPNDPPPSEIITADDSHAARMAASMVLGACRERFGTMAPRD